MLDVVTEEAAIPRMWEYPTALVMEFGADGKDVAAAFDECMIVHAGHRLAGPPTAAAKPSGAAGSSGAWSASRATSAATSPTPKRKRFKTAMLQTAHRLSTESVPLMCSRRSWPRPASRDDGRAGSRIPRSFQDIVQARESSWRRTIISRACRRLARLRSGAGARSATRRRSSRRSNRSSSSRRRSTVSTSGPSWGSGRSFGRVGRAIPACRGVTPNPPAGRGRCSEAKVLTTAPR